MLYHIFMQSYSTLKAKETFLEHDCTVVMSIGASEQTLLIRTIHEIDFYLYFMIPTKESNDTEILRQQSRVTFNHVQMCTI